MLGDLGGFQKVFFGGGIVKFLWEVQWKVKWMQVLDWHCHPWGKNIWIEVGDHFVELLSMMPRNQVTERRRAVKRLVLFLPKADLWTESTVVNLRFTGLVYTSIRLEHSRRATNTRPSTNSSNQLLRLSIWDGFLLCIRLEWSWNSSLVQEEQKHVIATIDTQDPKLP